MDISFVVSQLDEKRVQVDVTSKYKEDLESLYTLFHDLKYDVVFSKGESIFFALLSAFGFETYRDVINHGGESYVVSKIRRDDGEYVLPIVMDMSVPVKTKFEAGCHATIERQSDYIKKLEAILASFRFNKEFHQYSSETQTLINKIYEERNPIEQRRD